MAEENTIVFEWLDEEGFDCRQVFSDDTSVPKTPQKRPRVDEATPEFAEPAPKKPKVEVRDPIALCDDQVAYVDKSRDILLPENLQKIRSFAKVRGASRIP